MYRPTGQWGDEGDGDELFRSLRQQLSREAQVYVEQLEDVYEELAMVRRQYSRSVKELKDEIAQLEHDVDRAGSAFSPKKEPEKELERRLSGRRDALRSERRSYRQDVRPLKKEARQLAAELQRFEMSEEWIEEVGDAFGL
ncbi:hypothetical protein G3I44_14535 [Halogeometricum borinquense]|uniref:Uncharacterized protein n=1 Tax=Halogeometricum borinquense TaxID=60847 RepID=A0A6C0UIL3_9EURY|nr:hypothetical protein [Halogeometricum borinquense]QIB75404.1 hypothetical protein G3I44_14535 [Halogeometricum borinquense]